MPQSGQLLSGPFACPEEVPKIASQFSMEAVLNARFDGREAFREASTAADELSGKLDQLDPKKVEISVSVRDSASGDLKDIDRTVDRLDGKTATLTARVDDRAFGDLKDVDWAAWDLSYFPLCCVVFSC